MYRKNVCSFIFNEDGLYLACFRVKGDYYQCVQGGIEASDTNIEVAARREIEEEIGLSGDDVTFVQEIAPPNGDPMKFSYLLRPQANLRRYGFIGQQQRVLLFFMPAATINKVVLVPPPQLHAQQEFSRVEWLAASELTARCPPEKVHIFETVTKLASPIVKQFLESRKGTVGSSVSSL